MASRERINAPTPSKLRVSIMTCSHTEAGIRAEPLARQGRPVAALIHVQQDPPRGLNHSSAGGKAHSPPEALAFIPPRTLAAIIDGTGRHDATVTALAQAVPYRWDRNPAE
jgi:hypothetical protein